MSSASGIEMENKYSSKLLEFCIKIRIFVSFIVYVANFAKFIFIMEKRAYVHLNIYGIYLHINTLV